VLRQAACLNQAVHYVEDCASGFVGKQVQQLICKYGFAFAKARNYTLKVICITVYAHAKLLKWSLKVD
jgi:hypothetical protein